ncbi:MAG: hypothetical protein ACYCVY_12570 [Acidiferrobacteraceae bacterium]
MTARRWGIAAVLVAVSSVLLVIYLTLPVVYRVDAAGGMVAAVVYADGSCQLAPPRLPTFFRTREISNAAYAPMDCWPRAQRALIVYTRRMLAAMQMQGTPSFVGGHP